MGFQRIVTRQLPDKTVRRVYPFHISLEGMESVLLCRDDEDYDTMIKYNHICSWVNNVLVIIEIAMSNHGHVSVLAQDYEAAERTGVYQKELLSIPDLEIRRESNDEKG